MELSFIAWSRLRNDLGVRQRKCNFEQREATRASKNRAHSTNWSINPEKTEHRSQIYRYVEGKALVNLSSILRSAKTLDSHFSPLTMSDSASHDDKTSLRNTNQTEKMEKKEEAAASTTVAAAAAAVPYPSNHKRILIMTALYLAVFLVTLVRPPLPFQVATPHLADWIAYLNCRTKTLYRQQSHGSRMSSTRWMTLDGTALHICLPCVAFSCSWAKSTNSTRPSQSSSPVLCFLRLVRPSAGQPRARKLSLLVVPLQDWDLLECFRG